MSPDRAETADPPRPTPASRTLELVRCGSRAELLELAACDQYRRRYMLEVLLAREHQASQDFSLPGFCLLDDQLVEFGVDWAWAPPPVEIDWLSSTGEPALLKLPNWRERLVCPRCAMNNRQRAIAVAAVQSAERQRSRLARAPRAYLAEQVTPLYRFLSGVEKLDCVGSEYLGAGLRGGEIRDGVRHEDAEALSFENASFDLVVSCSVLEHVDQPTSALAEMARILRPGGELFLEVPFDVSREENRRRASLDSGRIQHLLPAQYHGNPLSSEGALVFTDFGWELFHQMAASGYWSCEVVVYWSLELGHLGGLQFFFRASRTGAPWRAG